MYVCDACGKRMPKCWDVICSKCGGKFCYSCCITVGDRWYCPKCAPQWHIQLLTLLNETAGARKESVISFATEYADGHTAPPTTKQEEPSEHLGNTGICE